MSVAAPTTRQPPATTDDRRDGICVVGTREHNLKNASPMILEHRVTLAVHGRGSRGR